MNFKSRIYKLSLRISILKKIYFLLSYVKRRTICYYTLILPLNRYKKKHSKRVYLVFTPEHANLGDHAIAIAEQRMLQSACIDYYEITGKQLGILDQFGYLNCLNDGIILINGGGNLGTLWPDIERLNRKIIQANLDAKIVFMPNSIYYDVSSKADNESFQLSKIIYNSHKHLYFFAREEFSYEIMRSAYQNVKLIPDMVFSLPLIIDNISRSGCIICLRNDIEKTLSSDEERELIMQAQKIYGNNIIFSSTVLDHDVSPNQRKNEVSKKLDEFKKAELVITDRLHGMIFCAITGTNCIVLSGKSPKIRGCYKWIHLIGNIVIIDKASDFFKAYHYITSRHASSFPNLESYFTELKKDIICLLE